MFRNVGHTVTIIVNAIIAIFGLLECLFELIELFHCRAKRKRFIIVERGEALRVVVQLVQRFIFAELIGRKLFITVIVENYILLINRSGFGVVIL